MQDMTSAPLRVCLANDSFPPLIDGVANTVLNYAAVLTAKYGSAVVATPRYPGVTDDYPFPVVRYHSLNTTRLLGYRTGNPFEPLSIEKLAAFAPNVIHCHCPLASALLCRELREVTGAPIVFTYHTKFDIDISRAVKFGLVRDAALRVILDNIEACDRVWVVNRGAGENLRSLGYTGEYKVMPNGVDFPRGAAAPEAVEKLRTEYGLDRNVPCFLFVGRMMWYKGQRVILEGLRRLADSGRDFRMVFVGDGDNLGDIRALAEELELGEKCVFTGAVRDRERLRTWYTAARLFLLPSVFDNNPIVVKEAAACGTASVLIRDSSAAEGVEDGVNGFLIGEDPAHMAAVLARVCDDGLLAPRLGRAAQDTLYASWEDMIDAAAGEYRSILREAADGGLKPHQPVHFDKVIGLLGDLQSGFDRVRDLIAAVQETL